MRKILVFSDPGLDDALALTWLLTRAEVEVVAVVAVSGNLDAAGAAVNASRLLEACGRRDIPVLGTGHQSQVPGSPLPSVHGHDGIGDLLPPGTWSGQSAYLDALPACDEWLVLAPATIAALAQPPTQPVRVTWMGGVSGVTGNSPDGGECNCSADLLAAERLLVAGAAVVPLDATRGYTWTQHSDLPDLHSHPSQAAAVFRRLARRYLDLAQQRRVPVATPHDLTAAAVMVEPNLAAWQHVVLDGPRLRIEVEASACAALALDTAAMRRLLGPE